MQNRCIYIFTHVRTYIQMRTYAIFCITSEKHLRSYGFWISCGRYATSVGPGPGHLGNIIHCHHRFDGNGQKQGLLPPVVWCFFWHTSLPLQLFSVMLTSPWHDDIVVARTNWATFWMFPFLMSSVTSFWIMWVAIKNVVLWNTEDQKILHWSFFLWHEKGGRLLPLFL